MKKQIIISMFSLSLVFSTFAVQGVYATKPDPSVKLDKIQKEKEKATNELKDASKDMEEKKKSLEALEKDIVKLDTDLNDLNKSIQLEEQKMNRSKESLEGQVRQMYESGEYSFFKQLLSSVDFGNFFEKLDQTRFVLDAQNDQIKRYLTSKKKLEGQQAEMKTKLEAQKPLVEEAKKKYEELVKEQEKLKKDVEKLKEDEEVAKEEIAEKNKQVQQATQFYDGPAGSGQLGWPMKTRSVSSGFGPRGGRMHEGIDFRTPIGTPIYAADSGRVVLVKSNPGGYGNYVVIAHGNNISTLYAHMKRSGITVSVGQSVQKGQLIAYSGNEGRSSGPHLHFEVHKGSTPVNPLSYLR
ncbi:Murein DD-endopeptidase MepM and murein hydrolase activator NlpD, contain LysM domain [Thermoactinomyces sp. DSM 45891]|uniref:murein hydrolase activator EnvC family protein n=1 Tax=Thermoactinomyces sp. DSM 45891 TaxID=1761907 RepID=UPI00091C7068|nr:peptidoglycan DD-metalloendopeptidase family protein [Thermoactinomyces sp. DSM 45891]SFX22664.1 Murein DD-endopeptidase MepM and murein hydrolase activator NlpD, contain LysM domain [Thermoactinomyces sp. DSM 45891]